MSSRLNEIREYLAKTNSDEKYVNSFDKKIITLTTAICKYAHRNQTRENGEVYSNHPLRLVEMFEKLIGEDETQIADYRALEYYKIPYFGVKEVALLHDVVEDTNFTFADIEEIYKECGFDDYYEKYIAVPLKLITHNKKEDYEIYVSNLLQNKIASMVKFLDLQDNMNYLDLIQFGSYEYQRAQKYLKCFNYINMAHRFLEHAEKYKKITKHLMKVKYYSDDSIWA